MGRKKLGKLSQHLRLDGQIASVDSMQKKKKLRLDVSKSKGKTGSMLYVRPVFPLLLWKTSESGAAWSQKRAAKL